MVNHTEENEQNAWLTTLYHILVVIVVVAVNIGQGVICPLFPIHALFYSLVSWRRIALRNCPPFHVTRQRLAFF